jgi:hypothetical protein
MRRTAVPPSFILSHFLSFYHIFFHIFFIFCSYEPEYAATKSPGAASRGPSQNIFIHFTAKPHPIIYILTFCKKYFTSINTGLFFLLV